MDEAQKKTARGRLGVDVTGEHSKICLPGVKTGRGMHKPFHKVTNPVHSPD
jgi:hypothetical protein